jgi:hypothetical protein
MVLSHPQAAPIRRARFARNESVSSRNVARSPDHYPQQALRSRVPASTDRMKLASSDLRMGRCGAVIAFSLTVASARPANGQQPRLIDVGIQTPRYTAVGDSRPSGLSLSAWAIGGAVADAAVGGALGLTLDYGYCKRHPPDEQGLFGPCFLPASGGTAAGWFGGSILGSTLGAVRVAEKRGCPRGAAILRAAIGAALGSAPGAITAASRSGQYTPARSVFIFAAPLLSGVGAAAAVAGCHVP